MNLQTATQMVGHRVYYHGPKGPEPGYITRVNDTYVFVRFEGKQGSKACAAETLSLARKGD